MQARSDTRRSTTQLMENALTLDIDDLLRRGVLARGSWTRGVISWLGPAGEVAASVSYEADMASAAGRYLRLRFSTLDPRGGGRRQADQRVALAMTRPGFGGGRILLAVNPNL